MRRGQENWHACRCRVWWRCARVCMWGGGLTGKGREQLLLNGAMYLILYCIHLAYHVVETFGDIPLGLRVDEPRDHHPPLLHQRTPHLVRINPTTRKRNHVNNRSNGGGGLELPKPPPPSPLTYTGAVSPHLQQPGLEPRRPVLHRVGDTGSMG